MLIARADRKIKRRRSKSRYEPPKKVNCLIGDHGWNPLEGRLYRCWACSLFGHTKNKVGGRLRDAKVYPYRCSAQGCEGPAKKKIRGTLIGGNQVWSCGAEACDLLLGAV